MSEPPRPPALCWVCLGATRRFWVSSAFAAVACQACGHIQARHRPPALAAEKDYHLAYDQEEFVASLGATRRRQAGLVLQALEALSPRPRSVFDFGCGRGWFLEVAGERGMAHVAGGDVSELALRLLERRGVAALKLDVSAPFEHLDIGELPFVPDVVTFLDVLEHFSGDLVALVGPWLARLPESVRVVVIKVPVRDGLLFTLADLARRLGQESLGQQLFQAGTVPPHQQYFSRGSLGRFVRRLGLTPLTVLDDLDFEPEALVRRLAARGPIVRGLGALLGAPLGRAIRASRREDTRIVIATR